MPSNDGVDASRSGGEDGHDVGGQPYAADDRRLFGALGGGKGAFGGGCRDGTKAGRWVYAVALMVATQQGYEAMVVR